MTLQEAKDQVAQSWGLKDFKAFQSQGRVSLDGFYDKVAELYGKEKWNEGSEALKDVLRKKANSPFEVSMLNATPKPEFKP